ncbi:hypothetical protein [Megavirus chiliensis]|uniref:Uncharacterized protein n=2 Tax=Megamimivirinae TaxID=3044648 RepID=A0A2L2DNK0_MIMIV|nr:hypothetical protein MegaChil _gp0892 [Megavirus chiliensis]AEQ33226.1 hypothetical protein [Megavirus chiliensis]AVG47726.1 hypothetical protein [Acanthamoeba polyphaga mimivirus]
MKIKSIYHIPENKYDANPFSRSNIHNKKFRKIIKHITDNYNYPTTVELEKKIKGFKYAIYEGDAYHYNDTAMSLFNEYDCNLFDEILGDIILYNNEKLHLHLKNLIKEYEKNESQDLDLNENISDIEETDRDDNKKKLRKEYQKYRNMILGININDFIE